MQIEHLALWVRDLEGMRDFYLKYFDTTSGEKYVNPGKQFTAYFILFGEDKTRLELMTRPDITSIDGKRGFNMGLAHFTISVGGKDKVNALTERLRKDNYTILASPGRQGMDIMKALSWTPKGIF